MRAFRSFSRRKLVRDTLILQLSRTLGAAFGTLSVIVVVRGLGLEEFGRWGLLLALNETWSLLNLSGVALSTQTRLAIALGGGAEREEIADLLAQYLLFALAWAALSFAVLSALAPTVTRWFYTDAASIGMWSGLLSLRILGSSIYQLALICFRNHRLMRVVAILHALNQVLLLALVVLALSVEASLPSMVYARLAHAWLLMLLAVVLVWRLRAQSMPRLPTLRELATRLPYVTPHRDWRFGVMNALDKNLGTLFVKIALQWVGAVGGPLAVAPFALALRVIERITFLATGLFENMSAVIPRLVGAGEYGRLWYTLRRVQLALLGGSLVLNGLLFFILPLVVPPLFGAEESAGAVPLMRWLLLYATIVTVTGVFGPLYRAQRQVRLAALAKLAALALASLPAYPLISQHGALGGVLYIILLYAISGALTARFTLAELKRRAAN